MTNSIHHPACPGASACSFYGCDELNQPKPEHRCGPTHEQTMDAAIRGEVMGTYERCDECAARERKLLEGITFLPQSAVTDTVDYARISVARQRTFGALGESTTTRTQDSTP